MRYADPSTSVITDGCPAIRGSVPTTHASKPNSTIDRWRNSSPVAEFAAGVQRGQPCRRSGATWRAVDLAVGEDRDVPLLGRPEALPEDHAVDAGEIGLVGVDDCDRALECRPQLPLQVDELGEIGRVEPKAERGGLHRP